MASDSGWDRGNIRPRDGEAPGRRSMAQSVGRCSGSWDAFFLLKASRRSVYTAGMLGSLLAEDSGSVLQRNVIHPR